MIGRRFRRYWDGRSQAGLSSLPSDGEQLSHAFDRRLQERLKLADGRRRRRSQLRRIRWMAMIMVPFACAICWALLPITFGDGVRALAGVTGYVTMLLAVGQELNQQYLAYLNLSVVPVLIDLLLLVGVVSWLIWASHSDELRQPTIFDGQSPG